MSEEKENDPHDLSEPAALKNIRTDQYDYWYMFINAVTACPITVNKRHISKPPLRTLDKKNKYGWRLNKGEYEVYEVGKGSLFERGEKLYKSKHQSFTVVSVKDGFQPPTFHHDADGYQCGVRINHKDVLAQRIMQYDGATVGGGSYKHSYKSFARLSLFNNLRHKKIHPSFQALYDSNQQDNYNECMLRVWWNYDGTSQLCLFDKKPITKLKTLIRAQDLKNRGCAQYASFQKALGLLKDEYKSEMPKNEKIVEAGEAHDEDLLATKVAYDTIFPKDFNPEDYWPPISYYKHDAEPEYYEKKVQDSEVKNVIDSLQK